MQPWKVWLRFGEEEYHETNLIRYLLHPRLNAIGRSEILQGTGRVSNFNQSIIWRHHVKGRVEIGHLTKFDVFRVNRDQVMDLEIQNPYKRL